MLIAPTVFGNVMLGPTAEDVERKDDTESTRAGIDHLMAEGGRIMPELLSAWCAPLVQIFWPLTTY